MAIYNLESINVYKLNCIDYMRIVWQFPVKPYFYNRFINP